MTISFAEIAAAIGASRMARVRSRDADPTLALYRVAREGWSAGAVAGLGKARKYWSGERVVELAKALDAAGSPVYRGHSISAGARRPVGNIVKCFTKNEREGIAAYAAIHLFDKRAAEEAIMKQLDAASVEVDATIEKTLEGLNVASVEKATGLALGSSEVNPPGFADAKIVGAVRESDEIATGDEVVEEDSAKLADEFLSTKNLNAAERGFVRRRVLARLGPKADLKAVGAEASGVLADLAEAKSIYRKPVVAAEPPAEKRRGPFDYADPAHNDLIP